jgi:hypothetical protein
METIRQVHYPKLEIDCTEKDIIQIYMNGKEDSNVIQIEKWNLQAVIDILQPVANNFKPQIKLPLKWKKYPTGQIQSLNLNQK